MCVCVLPLSVTTCSYIQHDRLSQHTKTTKSHIGLAILRQVGQDSTARGMNILF